MVDESQSICSSKWSWCRAGVHSLRRAALFFFPSETNPNYSIKPGFSHLFTMLIDPLVPVRGKSHPSTLLLEEILPESSCQRLESPEETYGLESAWQCKEAFWSRYLVVRSQRPRLLPLQGERGSALPTASGSGRNVVEGSDSPGAPSAHYEMNALLPS